ncbi:hypothetical protein Pla123a_29390 [Posidoniimonas polymericola]|uniref:Uncharacterized protein n=1 Tax=Posidoniimonas polymericola TaxID=2528002 RepID=A0A5C5YMT4_9BACT|nr:hypothetical protein [Posidoniimonas polymericola]TWT76150.1 hypothetical protein Pla123a_29390 [Posidoniimonas polymericola]
MKTSLTAPLLTLLLALTPALAMAQSAESGVDVGPGGSGASAGYVGDWGIADTESRDGFGRALGVGVSKDGVAISHSIGASNGSSGVGHNFNMAIGRDGAHVSQGGVVTSGGNGRVEAGGSASQFGGGSDVVGWGNNTKAWTESRTRRWSNNGPQNGGNGQIVPWGGAGYGSNGSSNSGGYQPAVMPRNSGGYQSAVMPSNSGSSRSFSIPGGRKLRFGK